LNDSNTQSNNDERDDHIAVIEEDAPPFLSNHRLPPFVRVQDPNFMWSESVNGEAFSTAIKSAYAEVVKWRRNIFLVPSGKIGERFVRELSRLFRAYGEATSLESVALTAAMVMPHLLLQKPHSKSNAKEHVRCLERRLDSWSVGKLEDLLNEGRAIQSRLLSSRKTNKKEKEVARSFSRLMRKGRVASALRLLSQSEGSNSILKSSDVVSEGKTVLDELKEKHPQGRDISDDNLFKLDGDAQRGTFHPVIFECINGESIRRSALRTNGAAGPSGIDAFGWRRLCTSFRRSSDDLCNSLACVAQRLSSSYVDPAGINSLVACRLIAIDKQPGIRPIGIGEVARRIISKAILTVINDDVKEAAGGIQLCVGQQSGCEAGVHAMRRCLDDQENDAILLADASNAFNTLNRRAALANIHSICPSIAITLTNVYRGNAELFIDEETILSKEGTTQGDPLAMSMYGLGILPLINKLKDVCRQVWFADDAASGGKIEQLKEWWSKLLRAGPAFGYIPNPSKTWLIVKEDVYDEAKVAFANSGINISSSGRKHLGSALGKSAFVQDFLKAKVDKWSKELELLTTIAKTEPHTAYSALTHGLMSKWTYIMRTTPEASSLLTPLEDILRHKFIPAITGRRSITDVERELFALPCRLGGLGIPNPTIVSDSYYNTSFEISAPLVQSIIESKYQYSSDVELEQNHIKYSMKKRKREQQNDDAMNLRPPDTLKRAMELAKEKGSSSWLTALPLESHGFALHKSSFRDALCLRYGWQPERLPTRCDCGDAFTVDHALNCPRGAFPTIRHNEVRDFTGQLLTEVCHDVCIEPVLQPLEGERLDLASSIRDDNARTDIRARGFWGCSHQCAFLDVKVFNPNAQTNRKFPLAACYPCHEKMKKRAYEQRVTDIEHGSFTPLVFSTTGGMGELADTFYRRLASLVSAKRDQPYHQIMGWMRCHLSFSLLRSAVMCLRGSRSSSRFAPRCPDSIDLAISEARII
jgi:hypothetical protein